MTGMTSTGSEPTTLDRIAVALERIADALEADIDNIGATPLDRIAEGLAHIQMFVEDYALHHMPNSLTAQITVE
jgi:hypothetical protein